MQRRSRDRDLHRVPVAERDVDVLGAFLHEAALAAFERPEHQVVLFAVEADRQVIAVRFQIEEDAGALIELACEQSEADRDFAVAKIIDVLRHGIWEVRVRLDAVDELLVLRAVNRARLRCQSRGRLAFDPLTPVDLQHVIAGHIPVADDGEEMRRRNGDVCCRGERQNCD